VPDLHKNGGYGVPARLPRPLGTPRQAASQPVLDSLPDGVLAACLGSLAQLLPERRHGLERCSLGRGGHSPPDTYALGIESERHAAAPPTLAVPVELGVGADGAVGVLEADTTRCGHARNLHLPAARVGPDWPRSRQPQRSNESQRML